MRHSVRWVIVAGIGLFFSVSAAMAQTGHWSRHSLLPIPPLPDSIFAETASPWQPGLESQGVVQGGSSLQLTPPATRDDLQNESGSQPYFAPFHGRYAGTTGQEYSCKGGRPEGSPRYVDISSYKSSSAVKQPCSKGSSRKSGKWANGGSAWPAPICDNVCGDSSFGCCDCLPPPCCDSPWFAAVGGVIMTRDQENHYRFSYDHTAEEIQLLDTHEAALGYVGGIEARIGRTFCCGAFGIELVYWGLTPDSQESLLLAANTPGNLMGILNWDQLNYNGQSADNWVDNAAAHRVRREHEFHHVQANLWKSPVCNGNRHTTQWMLGAGYFRFGENLLFNSDSANTDFIGAAHEIGYNVDVQNDLFGGHIGGQSRYCLTSSIDLTARVSGGLYANRMSHHSRIGGSAGDATINNGAFNTQAFNIRSTKNDVAIIAEIDTAVRFRLWQNIHGSIGYRALGVNGVALPTNQIYSDLRALNDVAEVDSNGSLILHGGYARLEWNY